MDFGNVVFDQSKLLRMWKETKQKQTKTWEFFPTGEGGLKQNLLFSQPVVGKKEGGSISVIEVPTYFYLRHFTLQRNILTKF